MSSRQFAFSRGRIAKVAVTPVAAALAFVATLVLLAGFGAWLIAATRAAITWRFIGDSAGSRIAAFLQSLGVPPRLPLIACSSRQLVPWSAIDLLTLLGVFVLCFMIAAQAADIHFDELYGQIGLFRLELSHEELLIAANTFASLAILAIGLSLIAFRTGAGPCDFGWSMGNFVGDLKTGLVAFVMLAPPVYAVQGLLVTFWQESKHPLVEMFKEQPSISFFAIVFVSAAIVAPLFEEMVFRVLLQGYLEKIFAQSSVTRHPAATSQLQPAETNNSGPNIEISLPPDNNPYATPNTDSCPALQVESAQVSEVPKRCSSTSWLPILISSAIFAALHYSHGPDWIPLFFLALGLGYLYQRTHRLLPSLVVHSLLNTLSMWGLWVTVHQPPAS
jgi:membrane protease YdiL (CAAX protease family)